MVKMSSPLHCALCNTRMAFHCTPYASTLLAALQSRDDRHVYDSAAQPNFVDYCGYSFVYRISDKVQRSPGRSMGRRTRNQTHGTAIKAVPGWSLVHLGSWFDLRFGIGTQELPPRISQTQRQFNMATKPARSTDKRPSRQGFKRDAKLFLWQKLEPSCEIQVPAMVPLRSAPLCPLAH